MVELHLPDFWVSEQQRLAIYAVLFYDTDYTHLYLYDYQLVVMGQMVKTLKVLQVATAEHCEPL